jgi:AGZA family xanthine/uracil permease-like MFS transporter
MRAGGVTPRLWTTGDLYAYFGLFTNVLLNVIVLTGLVLGVIQLPSQYVFGRILPALAIALPIGNLFYAYLAIRLARKEGRTNVTAMPYGPSVPHMFIVVFLIMLPIYLKTKDPILAWESGLAWAFLIGTIVLIGAFVGPTIRKYTPRAALLGTLAGISLTFIAMSPAFQMWDTSKPWGQAPLIAFISFAIVLIGWMARVRLPGNIPAGLVAVVIGTGVGWLTGYMDPNAVSKAVDQFGLFLPNPSLDHLWNGLTNLGPLLITAIPLGIYNFTEAMSNVESAAAAGDNYNLRYILLADGIGAVVGSGLGSPFPPAVYIGHPGWKAVGGRIGYSLATGVSVALVCFLGLIALLLAIIPLVAILPILLFIGLVITSQAFQATPSAHAPAVVLAFIPNLASWGQNLVDNALGAAGTNAGKVGFGALGAAGVIYGGMQVLGSGAVLAGMVLGAVLAFIIDREFRKAAIYAFGGSILSFFGFIHSSKLDWVANWQVAIGYALMGCIFLVFAYVPAFQTAAESEEEAEAEGGADEIVPTPLGKPAVASAQEP